VTAITFAAELGYRRRVSVPEPSLNGVAHRFVVANGLRFHVAECGAGDRLALLLHGFPETWYSWRHQLPLLARLGYRVWAPDLRGYGTTDRPSRMADYAVETLLEDVAGLVDAAGAKSTTLVAHDWGGILAWLFAMRRTRPLERLVVMNLPHPGAAAPAFRTLRQLRRSWYVAFFQIPWLPERLLALGAARVIEAMRSGAAHPENFPDEALAVFREAVQRPGAAKAMLDYYRALVRGGGLRRQRALGWPVIDVPTLLIWGENDIALCKETSFGTDRFVSDLSVRYLPGISHFVQQDAPDLVNALLEAQLRGRC
jgi:pimeloyl-ACP methyl ester carboxylesterase